MKSFDNNCLFTFLWYMWYILMFNYNKGKIFAYFPSYKKLSFYLKSLDIFPVLNFKTT